MRDPRYPKIEKLLRQQAALAEFGSFAFHEPDLLTILAEGARICAGAFAVPFCKICRHRPEENDMLVEAGCGWQPGVIGRVFSLADEGYPHGRAFMTGQPVVIRNIDEASGLSLPPFYAQHGIVSMTAVVIPGCDGAPWGVLEVGSPDEQACHEHDMNFLAGFANVLAEAIATSARVKTLRALVEQKDMLAEELQHRVRNNLQLVNNMLVSCARTAQDASVRQDIDLIVRRVTTLAQVYDHLLGSGMGRMIDFGEYLQALCATLPELQQNGAHPVELVCRADCVMLDLDAVTALGMAVAELVTNSYGHAFPDRAGRIAVTLTAPERGAAARLTISDDGIGFETGGSSKRRGLGLVRRLVRQAEGALDVRSGQGTTWTLTFMAADCAGSARAAA